MYFIRSFNGNSHIYKHGAKRPAICCDDTYTDANLDTVESITAYIIYTW